MKKNNYYIYVVVILLGIVFPRAHVLADTTIHLDIESATSTLFNDTITVSACSTSTTSEPTISGYCAIQQSGLSSEWSSYGGDQFLSSIAGISNDYSNNLYWGWFSNLEYGQTSLNQHILVPNEDLLINIGRMPLKVTVSTTTPSVGDAVTVSVFHFGFDDSWNGIWIPATSSVGWVGTSTYPVNGGGHYDVIASSTTVFTVSASEDGFLSTKSITISPVNSPTVPTSPDTNSSVGDSNSADTTRHVDVYSAIQFLLSKQKSDGSFGSSLCSDWAVIGLASARENSGRDARIAYMQTSHDALNSATDYERHAMALMALGINPYNGTSVNYIQNITHRFDGTQIGDASLVNDDIFALFPLLKAGYSVDDPIVQNIVDFIISKQDSNGSWQGSIDLTAAGIQALSLTQSLVGVSGAIASAHAYLNVHKHADGSFGSSFSTSWALQALASLGETNTGDSLALFQQNDGGFESVDTDESTRIWATAYAIPAMLNKPWASILTSFSKPATLPVEVPQQDVHIATTTIPLATSSLVVVITPIHDATSTPSVRAFVSIKKPESPPGVLPVTNKNMISKIVASQVAQVSASGGGVSYRMLFFILISIAGIASILYVYSLKNK